jgi:ABC-2 type transport system permease protein
MLQSVYLKTLRDLRWGVLGWGVGIGLLLLVTAAGWAIAYPDEPSRMQLTAQIEGGLSVAQVFYGPPRNIDTVGGFVEWRTLGLTPVLFGLYLILSATAMTRGAEESRTIEVVAATPTTRARLLIEQAAALATALVLASAILGVLTVGAGLVAGEPTPDPARVTGASANVAAGAFLFGALGLLTAQVFERRRTAALAATGAMVLCHFANTLPLAVRGLNWLRYLSPLYLYTRSSPLSNGHMDWLAFGGLLLVAALVAGTALFASERRDLFDTYHQHRRPLTRPEALAVSGCSGPATPQLFLRNSLGRGVRDAIGTAVSWAAGLSALAVLMTALVPNMRTAFLQRPSGALFGGLVTERSLLSALLFSFLLPPLIAVFGVTLAASWAGDEVNQRLELELAAPVPRWNMFMQRCIASVALQAVVLGVVALAIVVTIELGHVDIPVEGVGAASGSLLVLAACAVAMSFAIASWRPSLAAAAAGGVIAVSFFADLVIPLLGLPSWVRYLTMFGLYGFPLANGVSYWRVGVLFAATVAFAVAGAIRFQHKDIAK